ncbi:bactofilin family protein [Ruegeria sp. SCP11]|uniref:bactofilin family protein n=1 Tax=Ruegeria sp. SCP11 TaxID=3141378 RepID=UPI00333A9880
MASSIIQEDLTINGDISSTEGSVEIKGTVIGDLTAQSIIVQEGGSTNGTLSAKSVAVEGGHCGQLQCDDLKLASTARVKADVSAHSMSTESGAKIEGTVKITGKS